MRTSGQFGAGGRLVFPIIAVLLVIISLLILLSYRTKSEAPIEGEVMSSVVSSRPSEGDVGTMFFADKIVVPLALMTMPLRGAEKVVDDVRSRSEVFDENKKLKARIAELADAEMRANALAMKIKRFESLLSVDVGLDIPVQKIAARVVAEQNGPFARSALLNAGTSSGVKVGYAVMTEVGFYGHVVAVGKRSARVLRVEDINSRIAVMTPRSEARAIMVGTNGVEPRLQYVARDADWQDADIIVTSGDEGVLPRGLPIGVVKQISQQSRNVVLNSTGAAVDWVWVYPYTPVEPPIEEPVIESSEGNMDENPVSADDTSEPG